MTATETPRHRERKTKGIVIPNEVRDLLFLLTSDSCLRTSSSLCLRDSVANYSVIREFCR
jgi:hypothetical protein